MRYGIFSAERLTFEAFEDAVLDRLFALDAERAAEEDRQGLRNKKPGKPTPTPATAKKTSKKSSKSTTQVSLVPDPDPE